MGENVGGNAGGVGAVAGGEIDAEDDGGSGVWGLGSGVWGVRCRRVFSGLCDWSKSDEPAVRGGSGTEVGGSGFSGDGDAAEGGLAGDAEGGRVGEAGEDNLGSGGLVGDGVRTGFELEGKPAVGGSKFERSDADAVDAESGELDG
jgi:hypothetical protein